MSEPRESLPDDDNDLLATVEVYDAQGKPIHIPAPRVGDIDENGDVVVAIASGSDYDPASGI